MIHNTTSELYISIDEKLTKFENEVIELRGISNPNSRRVFIWQIIDSIRRIEYVKLLASDKYQVDVSAINLNVENFNPIRAAIYFKQSGNIEEAIWLTFLITHFSKHKISGWSLLKGFYSKMGQNNITWAEISNNLCENLTWLEENSLALKNLGGFGNHRKYESIIKPNGTIKTIRSYVGLMNNSQLDFFNKINDVSESNRDFFNNSYNDISPIHRFGRTAKFDFLTMLGKIELLEIEPDAIYVNEATGPKKGIIRLLGDSHNDLPLIVATLESYLNLFFGMQVLEDSICNWQKNTEEYFYFSG